MYHKRVMNHPDSPASAAQALADPIRFTMLARLLEGPATVADLVSVAGASQPNVSNHLALLREQGLVRGRRIGRQVEYEVANPAVAQAVEALMAIAGPTRRADRASAPLARARTCYDHLAGVLGVAVLDALVELDAVSRPDPSKGTIRLGDAAGRTFERLGVDVEEARRARRRFAYGCLDWTERRPHLGGSLGAAVCEQFLRRGWVRRRNGSRAVTLTSDGRRILSTVLRIPRTRLDPPGSRRPR
jgi:DNA-binding transcriptional ArsR family regulator